MNKIIASILQKLSLLKYCLKKKEVAVLMFHEVCKKDFEKKDSLSITIEEFIEFFQILQNNSTANYCTAYEMLNKKTGILITFDDIYENSVINAIPYLTQKGIPFLLFITEDYIDQVGYITSIQLKELLENPFCTIAYHTKSHPILRQLSEKEIEEECNSGKFQERIKRKCDFFAYPYGSIYAISKKTKKTVKRLGYLMAFTTIDSATNLKAIKKDSFSVPRLNMTSYTKEKNLRKLLKIFQ